MGRENAAVEEGSTFSFKLR